MADIVIPASEVESFEQHSVWQEIVTRIELRMKAALSKALDEGDARAAGEYRALESILQIPQNMKEEAKNVSSGKGRVSRLLGR